MYELRDHGIPVVQTVQDYKLVCPSYKLYVPVRQEICFRCRGHRYYNAIAQNCTAHGVAASALVCVEAYLERVTRAYLKPYPPFSRRRDFLRDRLVDGGVPPSRLWSCPNPIDAAAYTPSLLGRALFYSSDDWSRRRAPTS